MYTDPTGHWSLGGFLRSVGNTIKNNIKTIAAIAIGAVIAIYAPVLLGAYISNAFGVAVATGALAGFASGAIMTGTVKGALKGAVFGAISGGVSFGIGSAFSNAGLSHGANIFQNGKVGMQVLRAGAHGLSRGIISVARGGTFKSGFVSGFTSSFLSPGTTLGGNNGGGFTLRTSIASIVGGTASKLGGGKFSNGAVSGAFVHMFNAEWENYRDPMKVALGMRDGRSNPLDLGVGIGGGIHLGIVGVNAHYDVLNETCNACVRIGPGAYIGGGVESYGYATYGETSDEFYYTGGLGGDVMLGDVGTGGGVKGNFNTVAGTGGTRYGLGFGGSIGLDFCVNW